MDNLVKTFSLPGHNYETLYSFYLLPHIFVLATYHFDVLFVLCRPDFFSLPEKSDFYAEIISF